MGIKLCYFVVFIAVIWRPFKSKDVVILIYRIQFGDDRESYGPEIPEICIYLRDRIIIFRPCYLHNGIS